VASEYSSTSLLVELRADGVAIIRFDLVGDSLNTLQAGFAEELADVLSRLEQEPALKAVVFSSGKPDSADPGAPGPGSKHDSGAGDHHGSTPEIAANELRAKADARLAPGSAAAMHGATLGRAPARPGETANQLGLGSASLGEARKTEVGAVDHADIPEEYREQVGRYFEP